MSKELIQINNLHFQYDSSEEILKGINLTLNQGEVLGVIGPNGGGKTTLLKILVGILTPTNGTYVVGGVNILSKKFPNQLFGYVPQKKELNTIFPLTAIELLRLECPDGFSNKELKDYILRYKLQDFLNQQINRLSGGQLQRLLIARSLLKHPKVLLLDEPSTGLDTEGIDQLGHLINTIKNDAQQGIVIVDHNIKQILSYSDRVLCLNKSHHWHDEKHKLSKHILESVYHCEYEHELIHENINSQATDHYCCQQPLPHKFKGKK